MTRLSSWLRELGPLRAQLVWLLFAIIPAYYLIVEPAPLPATVLGWLGLLGHVVLFAIGLAMMSRIDLVDHGRKWVRPTATLMVLQMLATAAMTPALKVGALPMVTYIVATTVFLTPTVIAFVLTVLLVSISIVLAGLWFPLHEVTWAWLPLLWTSLALMVSRFAAGTEARATALQIELARAETREGVASDVHDLLGHSLSLITVKAELARRLVHSDPDAASRELTEITGLSREATDEVRATMQQLSAPDLARQLQLSRNGLESAGVEVTVSGSPEDVPESGRRLAAWVLREATTNVVRHAHAERCHITLTAHGVEIIDDGLGFDEAKETLGHGLRSMRSRARTLGARLTVTGDTGTHVVLEFA